MIASLHPLPPDLDPGHLPDHVAVIMDGNGRWAQQRGQPRFWGHRKGVDTLKNLVRCCQEWGIKTLTAYAFSSENWGRPSDEVHFLLLLIEQVLRAELLEMIQENVRIRFLGNFSQLPKSLQEEVLTAQKQTEANQGLNFTIAINYGGRQEIVQACQKLARAVQAGSLRPEDITEEVFAQQLYTFDLKDPDLLIRTSGEQRLSNYLLWQTAYTEQYFTPILWPDFDRSAFHQALLSYQARQRRFGKV